MDEVVDDLIGKLDSVDERSPEYRDALEALERLAENGSVDAAETVAEVFTFSTENRDPSRGYFWYHVALACAGYLTDFKNEHDSVEQYKGPVGDFRNEPQVSGLVAELGEARIREIDAEARLWLAKYATR